MDWLDRMNRAMDYLEENMAGEITYEQAAQRALCSSYHFQRMFSSIADIPLGEYIRRRRLTLAAYDIRNTREKIIDIAARYGYDSPDAFTRAFEKIHGIIPSEAREPGTTLIAYPRISFNLTVRGDKKVEYRIVERGSFKVFGKFIVTTNTNWQSLVDAQAFWNRSIQEGFGKKIKEIAGYLPGTPNAEKHLCSVIYDNKPDGSLKYMIAAELPDHEVPPEYTIMEIPAATWAVFTEVKPIEQMMDMHPIWRRIPEWFQATGYEYADTPEMEHFRHNETHRFGEAWIPIIKK
ncbi:MAG TPA: helix-turn-helix domain-containing protein [Clostridia bacterium]|nr:helix-turn-helix domain-containing protein [Clostridia bacterium]